MPLSKYFKGKGEQVMSDTQASGPSAPPPTSKAKTPPEKDSKPAKRKSIGQRMAERAGY